MIFLPENRIIKERECNSIEKAIKREMNRVSKIVLRFGKKLKAVEQPEGYKFGNENTPFKNAFDLAVRNLRKYQYVEGYLWVSGFAIIYHAWCVDKNNKIMEVKTDGYDYKKQQGGNNFLHGSDFKKIGVSISRLLYAIMKTDRLVNSDFLKPLIKATDNWQIKYNDKFDDGPLMLTNHNFEAVIMPIRNGAYD